MLTYIERLHKKPRKARKRIALMTTSFITFLIFAFWAISFPSSLPEQKYADLSPFSSLQNTISTAYLSIKDTFNGLGSSVINTSE